MRDTIYKEKILLNYCKNIKITSIFNDNGKELNTVLKEIILLNCNPLERKKLEL